MNQQSYVTIKKPLKQRKRSKIINKSNINRSEQSGSPANLHEYRLLSDALDELEELEEDVIDVFLFPPEDPEDDDTDTEVCNDADTAETQLTQIMEVTVHIKIQKSRRATKRTKKKGGKKEKKAKIPQQVVNFEDEKHRAISKKDVKVDQLLKSSENLETVHKWHGSEKDNAINTLMWKQNLGQTEHTNFNTLYDKCNGKMSVDVFEILFNQELRRHLVHETLQYAKVSHNDTSFTFSEDEIRKYIGVLLFSGYHILPHQYMYWERMDDISTPMFQKTISKNKFYRIKQYTHCADNHNLDKIDKLAKVRPLDNIANKSVKQFGYWHKDYLIDEQMIPYLGMHSAKQTMENKGTRFGYKNFVLTSSDHIIPYHIIPCCGAKGIAGTPGKDLTYRVVIEFILEMKNTKANLAFDNWYASTKLMSLLNAFKIPTICTARVDPVGRVPLLSAKQMAKEKRGAFSCVFNEEVGLHCV